VLVVGALPAIRAAKQVTKTIPIVMVTTEDPVTTGLIESLARPGGNITGLTQLTRELSGKRLELLTEVTPTVSRVGVLWYAQSESSTIGFKEYEAAALTLKIPLQSLELRLPNPDLNDAFRAAGKGRVSALAVIIVPPLMRYQRQIVDLTIKNRLPSIWERSEYVEAGGLVSYAASGEDLWRRSAIYVDKILKGAKPGDLPVEQPKKFEFIVNLKAAKQIA
jgi:putative ABC transport system substrate-binding protein